MFAENPFQAPGPLGGDRGCILTARIPREDLHHYVPVKFDERPILAAAYHIQADGLIFSPQFV